MSRSGERLAIVGLLAVIVLLVTVPAIGIFLRGIFTSLFGNTLSSFVGATANIIAIGGFVILLVRWLRSGSSAPTIRSVSTEASTTVANCAAVQTVRDEARNTARQIRRFVHKRDEDDPFHREEIPGNMDSPEYKELATRYDEHMNETRRLYISDHLPTVAKVRDAFADLGIRDPELDRLYENPRNYNELRTLADRLIAMADSLAAR